MEKSSTVVLLAEMEREKEELFRGYLLSSWHTIWSFLALLFSGTISTFGVYSVVKSALGDSMVAGLITFAIILIVIDSMSRKYLVKIYNSLIRKDILNEFTDDNVGKGIWKWKSFFYLTFVFGLVFDALGILSTANYIDNRYNDSEIKNSTEFKIITNNIEASKITDDIYREDLKNWKEKKASAKENCANEHDGWKAKYKARCLNDWLALPRNAEPIREQAKRGITKNELESIKKSASSFLTQYIWYIALILGSGVAIYLRIATLSSLQDANEEVRNKLDSSAVAIIKVGLLGISNKYLLKAENEVKESNNF